MGAGVGVVRGERELGGRPARREPAHPSQAGCQVSGHGHGEVRPPGRWGGAGAHSSPPPPPPEQNYCESRYHFLHSSDGEGCANMLVEYSTSRGFRSEVDMFVAQAVLQ